MAENQAPKIKLWRMEEMLKRFSTPIIAVIYIKLDMSYKRFNPNKKYDDKEVILFNSDAFFNAFKSVTGRKLSKLKQLINQLQTSVKSNQIEFMKYHKQMEHIIDDQAKHYDKFDLSFDDVLFSPKFFEDKRMKELLAKQAEQKKQIN